MRRKQILTWLLLTVALCSSPAGAEEEDTALDSANRASRRFNFWLLDHVFLPVARGYNFAVPKWGQARVRNLLENLDRPRDVANSLFQAKFRRAGSHLLQFGINTTVGLLGLFNPAESWFELASPETGNETLGLYGLPSGAFLILPVYGETCPRCLVGAAADAVLHPLFWIPGSEGTALQIGSKLLGNINLLARQMPTPFADDAEWEAFEARFHESHTYEETKQLFFENLRWDVEE